MGTTDKEENNKQLLIYIFVDRFGFDSLSTRFFHIPALDLYAAAFVLLDFGLINTYFHVYTGRAHGFIQNPFSLAIPASVLIAVAGLRYMTISHRRALDRMRFSERINDTEQIKYTEFTISLWSRMLLYICVLGVYYTYIFGIIGISSYIDTFGVVSTVAFAGVIYPLGYVPIAVDFMAQFVSVQFVLPRKIAKARPTPAFLDPRDLGGFYPIGELIKRTYYIYTAGLFFVLCYIYGPTITGFGTAAVSRAGTPEAVFFTLLWAFGLTSIGISMFTIHRLMANEKEDHLNKLEKEVHGKVNSPYDISSAELHGNSDFDQFQRRVEQVRAMREYPTSTNTSIQLLASILIPEIINLLLQSVY